MRASDAFFQSTRTFLIAALFAVAAPFVSAQTQAIEPCPATTPAKTAPVNAPAKIGSKATETLVDASIPNDPSLEKIISPYSVKVRELSVVIGRLEGELKKSGIGASSLGNFVTEAMISQARAKGRPAVLAITNAGGLRKNTITAGELRASDIFELLPFENALIEIDLTGVQLLKLLDSVTRGRDAQTGARVQFRWNAEDRPEFISAKLLAADGTEISIDAQATYTIVTIDYLQKLASGSYSILQEGTNLTPLNVTIRDAVIDYVKSETKAGRAIKPLLDNRFVQVGPGPRRTENSPND